MDFLPETELNMGKATTRLTVAVLSFILAGHLARAEDNSDCWAGKRRTDLSTGTIKFECMTEPESRRRFTRLRQLAELGAAGRKDAPYVVERLGDEDWDVRVEAARTLGRIGYTDAIPHLLAAITPNDWRLTCEAMVSLIELKAPQADVVLKNIAKNYWLPGIAETAQALTEGRPPPESASIMSFRLTLDICNAKADQTLVPICSSPIDDPDAKRHNEETRRYWRRFWRKFRAHPSMDGARKARLTLDVQDGKLIGSNHGEWGGELGFIYEKTNETQETIIDDNVLGIAERGGHIIVVTGLDHGGLNRGFIWEVTRAGAGKWSARRLWRLPGTPYETMVGPDGTIGLFGHFGSVLYRTDDTLQWLACGPYEWCRK